jgi:hypothetical protein
LQSFTWSVFDRGPVARALDLAIMCQESQGEFEFTDEMTRFVRLINASNEAQWICPVTTITALLDLAADSLEDQGADSMPPEFRDKISRAAEGMDGADYLRLLAGTIRLAAQDEPRAEVLSPTVWESCVRFRMLKGFHDNWMADGEYDSPTEAVRAAIDSEHPYCSDFLSPIASEAQRMFVLYADAQFETGDVRSIIPWASADALSRLLDTINGHMRREHRVPLSGS